MNLDSVEFWVQLFITIVCGSTIVACTPVAYLGYKARKFDRQNDREIANEFLVSIERGARDEHVDDFMLGLDIMVPKFDGVAITKYGERKVRISEPDPSLESDIFTAVATCGKCNAWGVHGMREPRKEPQNIMELIVESIRMNMPMQLPPDADLNDAHMYFRQLKMAGASPIVLEDASQQIWDIQRRDGLTNPLMEDARDIRRSLVGNLDEKWEPKENAIPWEWDFSVIRICNNCGHEWGQK